MPKCGSATCWVLRRPKPDTFISTDMLVKPLLHLPDFIKRTEGTVVPVENELCPCACCGQLLEQVIEVIESAGIHSLSPISARSAPGQLLIPRPRAAPARQ